MDAIDAITEICVVHLSRDRNRNLEQIGISQTEDTSWQPEETLAEGYQTLVSALGLQVDPKVKIRQITISVQAEDNTLAVLFTEFINQIGNDISKKNQEVKKRRVLILNLMPFYLSTTRLDKIIRGVFDTRNAATFDLCAHLVFMLRNIDWLFKSNEFSNLTSTRTLPIETWSIDIRRYGTRFTREGERLPFELPNDLFQNVLNLQHKRIYWSLAFETNSYIGHFAIVGSGAHVRTHYNLTQFISRDNVWEYMFQTFCELVAGATRLLVVGVGMENKVIQRFGDQVKSILGERIQVQFEYDQLTDPNNLIPSDWSDQFDFAIIVTDIVNSGSTVKPWLQALQDKNATSRSIRIFAVVGMKTPPRELPSNIFKAGVVIQRDFYAANPEKCPLCQVGQPIIDVKRAEDFCKLAPGQLTPFDFWEIVTDAKALNKDEQDPQGRVFAYRIDTPKLIKKYGHWLRNVIRHKYDARWPNLQIDVICVVQESTGVAFAELVAESVNVAKIVKVKREALRRITASGGLPDGCENPFSSGDHVLVVDDGMNSGKTMTQLINFCRAADIIPMGGMVLDSRLSVLETRKIRSRMSQNHLEALYTWPANSGAK